MRGFFGFLPKLQQQVESLPLRTLDRVNRPGGINLLNLFDMIVHPKDYTVYMPDDPSKGSIISINEVSSNLGYESIKNGQAVLCVISNDDIKLETLISSYFCVSTLKHLPFQKILTISPNKIHTLMPNVISLTHYESVRLTSDNMLLENENLLHTCGSGDLIPVLKFSGFLDKFIDEGGKYLVVIDLDSGFKGFDVRLLDHHISNDAAITCAVTEHLRGDQGALLCQTMGFDQLVEQFNFSSQMECERLAWTSAGMMIINANIKIDVSSLPWHRRKRIIDKMFVVQYERSMNDLTSMFETQFVSIPREMIS